MTLLLEVLITLSLSHSHKILFRHTYILVNNKPTKPKMLTCVLQSYGMETFNTCSKKEKSDICKSGATQINSETYEGQHSIALLETEQTWDKKA
jgi:hypothetical protein